ncbi:hypothetical protein [Variovorax sp. dw_954]|nr:hypothetical protein [Variovorax sp. dw_954]
MKTNSLLAIHSWIAAGMEWVAGDHAAEDSSYVRGPPPPEGFATNIESR